MRMILSERIVKRLIICDFRCITTLLETEHQEQDDHERKTILTRQTKVNLHLEKG